MRQTQLSQAFTLFALFVSLAACDRRDRLVPTPTGPWAGDITGMVTDLSTGAPLR